MDYLIDLFGFMFFSSADLPQNWSLQESLLLNSFLSKPIKGWERLCVIFVALNTAVSCCDQNSLVATYFFHFTGFTSLAVWEVSKFGVRGCKLSLLLDKTDFLPVLGWNYKEGCWMFSKVGWPHQHWWMSLEVVNATIGLSSWKQDRKDFNSEPRRREGSCFWQTESSCSTRHWWRNCRRRWRHGRRRVSNISSSHWSCIPPKPTSRSRSLMLKKEVSSCWAFSPQSCDLCLSLLLHVMVVSYLVDRLVCVFLIFEIGWCGYREIHDLNAVPVGCLYRLCSWNRSEFFLWFPTCVVDGGGVFAHGSVVARIGTVIHKKNRKEKQLCQ